MGQTLIPPEGETTGSPGGRQRNFRRMEKASLTSVQHTANALGASRLRLEMDHISTHNKRKKGEKRDLDFLIYLKYASNRLSITNGWTYVRTRKRDLLGCTWLLGNRMEKRKRKRERVSRLRFTAASCLLACLLLTRTRLNRKESNRRRGRGGRRRPF